MRLRFSPFAGRCGLACGVLLCGMAVWTVLLLSPPQASGGSVFAREPDVVVRSEPNRDAPAVTTVEEGEELEVTETWYRILLPSGREGWVRSSDVLSPQAGSKVVALVLAESGSASAAAWEPMIEQRFEKRFGEQVQWLDREAFGQMLAERGLSVDVAASYPEDFVGRAGEVDGIVVCECREQGEKARLDCRYVDMRVGGVSRRESALGEAGAVEELADALADQLYASLKELLVPAPEGAREARALPQEGRPDQGEANLLENMVLVPAGEFVSLGADGSKQAVWLDAFYIDKVEVTNAAFRAFDETYTYPEGADDHPASGISWYQAKAYAGWLGKRLPTEQEWEKACRSTDGRLFPWGEAFEADRANINTTGAAPVASYEKGRSPYGVYDLIGNVWEWTSSAPAGGFRTRVLRGGAWSSNAPGEGDIFRYTAFPDDADVSFGFRCALSADEVPQTSP